MCKETNVVELLERHLDAELVNVDRLLAENPASIRDPACRVMIKSTRDYRAKFPHTSKYPNVDPAIARLFSLLDGQKRD
jgi:hypothetical protein